MISVLPEDPNDQINLLFEKHAGWISAHGKKKKRKEERKWKNKKKSNNFWDPKTC